MSVRRGRTGGRWRKLKARVRARRGPCIKCGQPIDYSLEWPDPGSFSVEHIKPKATHPELAEDPSNLAASHLKCNQVAGARAPQPSLGDVGDQW